MANGTWCAPMLFRKKVEGKQLPETKRKPDISKNPKEVKGSKVQNSHSVAGNFITMAQLRTKVLTFRDLVDLPPCVGSASANELVINTLKDLQAMYPDIAPETSMSESEGTPIHQALASFCNALKSVGEIWTSKGEWMDKPKHVAYDNMAANELENQALLILDDMINMARERLFDIMDDDEPLKDYSPNSQAFGRAFSEYPDNKTPSSSPATPTSVLANMMTQSGSPYSSPLLMPLRIQAIGKLNPIDVKRLSFHVFPHIAAAEQMNTTVEELKQGKEENIGDGACEMMEEDIILMSNLDKLTGDKGRKWFGTPNVRPTSGHESLAKVAMSVVEPPPSLPMLRPNETQEVMTQPPSLPVLPKAEESELPTVMSPDVIMSPPPPPLPLPLPPSIPSPNVTVDTPI